MVQKDCIFEPETRDIVVLELQNTLKRRNDSKSIRTKKSKRCLYCLCFRIGYIAI